MIMGKSYFLLPFFVRNYVKCQSQAYDFFHLHKIPMTYKHFMPYFDKFYTCLWLKSEYIVVPLENRDTPKFYNLQFLAPRF